MAADTSARKGGIILTDKAVDPNVDGEILRNKEELKPYLENAAQKLVPLRFPGVHPGLNQLRNPSFEVDANGVTPPTGWTVTAGVVMVDTSQYYDGAKSCLIAAAAALNSQLFQTVPLKKGQYVRVSIACKASTASQARVHIELNGGDYSWYAVYSSPHTGGGAWEILSAVFGAVTSDTTAYILARKILDAATDIWFDHAVLEVFDAPVFPISTFSGVNTDTISEKTAAAGVTIDGVLVKDGLVKGRDPSVDGTKLDGISSNATRYVTRGVNVADFVETDFIRDGTWQVDGLNLAAIVPSGATAVHLVMVMRASEAGGQVLIRENATSNQNQILAYAQVINMPMTQNALVKIDADRLMDYFCSATVNFITLTVVGWVI